MTHQNTFEKLFWPLVILLHLAAFLQAWNSGGIYLVDSKDYLSQAYNFKTNWSLYAAPFDEPIRPDFYSFRPPLYAWFILAIKGIINSDYAVLAVQSLLSLYTLFSVKKKWLNDLAYPLYPLQSASYSYFFFTPLISSIAIL